ncbi:PREDICTED: ankyrin-1-like [Amphimedon queenslandica]|uniref:Uncharacterized protein n=1 Tax=Amphimedon queenslandica TaxID=400682 RepID=A0AAN0JB71_AMPQE|nr:PREDICTED: ankyrin-1-like [Amphimedon queenslandica]|eukprot:XP_019853991.1 PREDICTED: ankyrin-1-like [Amphimedon queenslandica]
MKKLLDSGADPNKRSGDEKRTALHWAAFYPFPNPKLGDPPKLKALLSMLIDLVNRREVDINSKDINDDTPLHIACMRSNNVAIPILLSCKDVLINKRNKHKGWTPLHRACQNDNERVAELLMKKKPNCLKRCNDGMTPLHLACQRGHDRIANVILSLCSDEDRIKILAAKDKNSYTPLHIACEKNDIELADILLKHDADPNMFNEKNLTPLFIAAKSGFVKILKLMLKRGPIDDIKKCTDNHKHNALHIACKGGHARAVKLLLEYDAAEITACNKDGLNPFEIAIKKEQKDAAMAIVNSEKWRDALMNVTTVKRKKKGICHRCNSRGCVECNNNDAYTQFKTPMRRAIKKMPAG